MPDGRSALARSDPLVGNGWIYGRDAEAALA
ncbi:hypothetical protein SAURM35S_03210 [Streptomyces aurantiogriseus]